MNDVALSLEGVGLSYRKLLASSRSTFNALHDVSFDVYRGETLGVIGRNGAGKSTLMKVIAGIVQPDAGRVVAHVERVQLLSLQVGFMQELTGRENVILSSLLLGMRRKDIEQKMEQIIAFSELADFIDKPLRVYSSGMRARLGFAISCQADPDLLIIDEAFGVGDMDFRKKSRAVIEQRMKTMRSFVLVSHSESMLMEYCERCVWLDGGNVRAIGKTSDVIRSYAAG